MSKAVPGAERIFRRKDGRWCCAVTMPDGRRQWIYGRTRQEVQDKRDALLEEISQGLVRSNQTLAKYLGSWLEDVRRYRTPGTYSHYETAIRLHISPYLGRTTVRGITSKQVGSWVARMHDEGRSPQVIAYARQVLSIAMNRAVRDQLATRNPVPGTQMPELPPPRRRVLTPPEWASLAQVLSSHRLRALYLLGITCGLRISEALGLTWADVDLGSRSMTVSGQIRYVPGRGLSLARTKTRAGRRVMILPELTVQALRDHWVRQARERAEAGEDWDPTWGLVFCHEDGRPLYSNTIARTTKKLVAEAGLPGLRFHDLRHTYANLLRSRRVDIKAVSELLGHASSSFTLGVYGHALLSEKEAAAQVIDASLS